MKTWNADFGAKWNRSTSYFEGVPYFFPYALKIFFHRFQFLSPSEPSKVKNHAQNSLFRGVKNHGFWHGFLLSRARRVTKNENDEKIFSEHISHTHSYRFRPKTWPTGIGEQNGTTLNLVTPPPSCWDFNNLLHIVSWDFVHNYSFSQFHTFSQLLQAFFILSPILIYFISKALWRSSLKEG